MFCPKCECEYKEGITICPDCNVELVDELIPEEEINELDAFIDSVEENSVNRTHVYISKAQLAEENKSSAAAMLLVGGLGVILIALILLGIIKLPLAGVSMYLTLGVMGVMFVIFIIVGIRSMIIYKTYKQEAVIEDSLTDTIKAWFVGSFTCEDVDMDAYKIGAIDELPDIEKFYKRIENIKEKISANYNDLDEAYLDMLCEDIFEEMYES